jgi:hypothetical protein
MLGGGMGGREGDERGGTGGGGGGEGEEILMKVFHSAKEYTVKVGRNTRLPI